MSPAIFSDADLDRLSGEVEDQLAELAERPSGLFKSVDAPPAFPTKQAQVVAGATGQDPVTFFEAFKKAARKDICAEGGIVHAQWLKYKDAAKSDLLKLAGVVLSAMGFAGPVLATLAVAVVVWLCFVGIDAYCEWSA